MTRVRSKRSDLVHLAHPHDERRTLCNRTMTGWLVEPDTAVTCTRCREAVEYN